MFHIHVIEHILYFVKKNESFGNSELKIENHLDEFLALFLNNGINSEEVLYLPMIQTIICHFLIKILLNQ